MGSAVGAAQPHPADDRFRRFHRLAGQRPQPVHVLRDQLLGERVDGAREGAGPEAENRAEFVVGDDLPGVQVPVEAADPHRGRGGGGQLHGDRLGLPHAVDAALVQVVERVAEPVAQAVQPVAVGGVDGQSRCGGPQNHQYAHAPPGPGDRHPQRTERERQPGHQLREPAHRLLRVGEQHGPPRAVGLGHREGPVHVHPPPGPEQRARQPGEHREPQEPGRPAAEVDTARVAAARLDGADEGLREYEGQFVRHSATLVSPGRGPVSGGRGMPGRFVPGHTASMLPVRGIPHLRDRPPPAAGRGRGLSRAWRRRYASSS